MEKDFLSYYRENLQHLRESSAEFAEAFPKIAARLELDGVECRDPFVERLLEGTAFLAARVEKRLDDGYPRLIESILSALAPGALAPEPSGAVARLLPIGSDDRVRHGAWLPAGASFKAAALGSATPCTFTTAIDAPILPVDIVRAQYALRASGRLGERLSAIGPEASAFMLELEHSSNAGWADLASGEGLPLRLYPAVSPEVASNIARLFLSDLAEVWVRPAAGSGSGASGEWRRAAVVRARSPLFDGRSAPLFSAPEGTLSGLELLHAAMAHPDFFRLIDIEGLFAALSAAGLPRHAEAAFLFRRCEPELVHGIHAESLLLNCVPVLNRFRRRSERFPVGERYELRVVPSRRAAADYEVAAVERVDFYSRANDALLSARSFAALSNELREDEARFSLHRRARIMPATRAGRQRGSYTPSDVWLSISGPKWQARRDDVLEAAADLVCTNADLPLFLSSGASLSPGAETAAAGIAGAQLVSAPSAPKSPLVSRGTAADWAKLSHLMLNLSSVLAEAGKSGATFLRNLLRHYSMRSADETERLAAGVTGLDALPKTFRFIHRGAVFFERGWEIRIVLSPVLLEGVGAYLLGRSLKTAVESLLPINTHAEIVLSFENAGGQEEVGRWLTPSDA